MLCLRLREFSDQLYKKTRKLVTELKTEELPFIYMLPEFIEEFVTWKEMNPACG